MVKFKEIKNYSGRKRINIVKDDGFKTGEKVVLLSEKEYTDLKQKKEDIDIDLILETTIKTINKNHEKQLQQLEKQVKEKEKELNQIKGVFTRFITQINGLSFFDLIFKHKHKELVSDFHDSVWIMQGTVEIEKKK